MTPDQVEQLQDSLQTLRFLLTGLYVLVGVVAVYLGWSLRRVTRNQVDSARLLQQATARLEQDLADQGG